MVLTPTHLAIVMEYASGGELFERICNAGRFSEDEVLICYIHLFVLSYSAYIPLMPVMLGCRHDSSSNNLYPALATAMRWYVNLAHLVLTFASVHFLPSQYMGERSELNLSICFL